MDSLLSLLKSAEHWLDGEQSDCNERASNNESISRGVRLAWYIMVVLSSVYATNEVDDDDDDFIDD